MCQTGKAPPNIGIGDRNRRQQHAWHPQQVEFLEPEVMRTAEHSDKYFGTCLCPPGSKDSSLYRTHSSSATSRLHQFTANGQYEPS